MKPRAQATAFLTVALVSLLSSCIGFPAAGPSPLADETFPVPSENATIDLGDVPVTEGTEIGKHEQILLAESASFVFQEQPREYFWDGLNINATKAPGYTGLTSPDIFAEILDHAGERITTCRTFRNWRWPTDGEMIVSFECNGNFSQTQKIKIASVSVELGTVSFPPKRE